MVNDNIIAATLYLLLSSAGVLLYVPILSYLVRNRHLIRKTPFYILLLQLSIGDLGELLLNVLYAAPCTYATMQVYGPIAGTNVFRLGQHFAC